MNRSGAIWRPLRRAEFSKKNAPQLILQTKKQLSNNLTDARKMYIVYSKTIL